ncbi:hypothetical protein ACFWN2_18310 [Lentzea sp. NPDC058436]|uniref:hypothetical protein n=1 Tax=Lentzea sp. NPDC058436 TaxID=3346499 RepID=UPI0036667FF2
MAAVLVTGADESPEIARLLEQAGHTVHRNAPQALDVLVNTAALAPETFEAKVAGLAEVLQTYLPALERSAAPVVVNVSDSELLTKAAATVVTEQYARAFPHVRINAAEQNAVARLVRDGGYFESE